MSNHDQYSDTSGQGVQPGHAAAAAGDGFGPFSSPKDGRDHQAADLVCQAEDLKHLLQQIAGQIADSDRRHSDSLRDMHERLALIGGQAQRVKSNVPREFQPAFERIEDAVSLLADRIALADRERQSRFAPSPYAAAPAPSPAETAPPVFAMPPAVEEPAAEPASEAPAPPAEDAGAVAEEPAVLKSAVSAAVEEKPAEADKSKAAKASDPFEFSATSVACDPAEPWDDESAEALVRLYDSNEPGLPARGAAGEPAALMSGKVAGDSSKSDGDIAGGSKIDEAWLEARFADIAARVEMSLADLRPDASFDAFNERFDQFEERMASALDNVATHQDLEGLRLVEEHIVELTSHLEQTQAQLARIEVIEDQIGLVLERVSSGQGEAEPVVHGGPSENDIQAIAETVARQVASSMSASQPQTDAGLEKVGDLQDMLKAFMEERRKGEENTTGALDTMQSALIHLLERVDAIETQQPVSADATSAAARFAGSVPNSAPQEYVREAVRFKLDGTPNGDLAPTQDQLEDFAERSRGIADAAASLPGSQPSARSRLTPPTDDELRQAGFMPEPAQPQRRQPSVEEPVVAQAGADRADFIAQARRAQQLAGERMAEEEAAAAATVKPGMAAKLAKAGPAKAGKAGAPAKKGLPRPVLMVAGVLGTLMVATFLYKQLAGPRGPAKMRSQISAPRVAPPKANVQGNMQQPKPAAAIVSQEEPAIGTARQPVIRNEGSVRAIAPSGENMGPVDKFEPRSIPRTVTDDLSSNETAPMFGETRDRRDLALASGTANEPPPGIVVADNGSKLTPETIARIRNGQRTAVLSSQLSQGRDTPPAGAAVTPAAYQQNSAAYDAAMTGDARSNSFRDLPPALVGPMSLRSAAANGDPSAEFEVAARFAEGKGIKQDFAAAAKWYQRSATRGFAPAQYRLGTLYERGLGVETNIARAQVWYNRAAKKGNVKAMHNLAVLNAGREGAAPDYGTAVQWFTEAAERGLADSQFNLGVLYGAGLGVPRSDVQSYKWFTLAAARGDKQAESRRDALRSTMKPADLANAERQARSWRQTPVEALVNDPRAAGQAWLGHGNTKKAG